MLIQSPTRLLRFLITVFAIAEIFSTKYYVFWTRNTTASTDTTDNRLVILSAFLGWSSPKIGWESCLRNDQLCVQCWHKFCCLLPYCVGGDVKPCTITITICSFCYSLLVILLHFAAAAPLLWNILPSYDNLTCPMVSLGSHLKHFFSEQYGHGTVQPVLETLLLVTLSLSFAAAAPWL